ncbi:MAG: tRNA adenosine(34) deaminase TadA [Candidatus Margulisbacteria bacterium]|nr:tRNA adenosine(34) deaminase TadA [Candidatus Margulisiibacteriota bacterium]
MNSSEKWMRAALKEAEKAYKLKEVPVGAVLVLNNKIVARGHNLSEDMNNFLSHAELLVLQKGLKKLGRWKIQEAELYVTLEPCAMCAGAIILSRIAKVVYGARDPKSGADGSALNVLQEKKINHRTKVEEGVLKKECGEILTIFFKKLRKKLKK